MNKSIKGILLFVALILPVLVFVFLKMFGKNQFDIPIYNHTSLEEGVNCDSVILPHSVDKVANILPIRTANIYHLMGVIDNTQLRSLMIVKDRLIDSDVQITSLVVADSLTDLGGVSKKYQINGVWSLTSTSDEEFLNYLNCEFLVVNKETLVLVDENGIIRGYYLGNDSEDVDRLILETKILLHSNE